MRSDLRRWSNDLGYDSAHKGIRLSGYLRPLGPDACFVMAGALAVSGIGYTLARRQRRPVFTARHLWPNRTDIDRPLVVGSVLFGIGWGLVGLCPGPALENLASLSPHVIVFVIAMIAGMGTQDLWERCFPSASAVANAALANSDG
jgi:uncharacterized protein